MHNRLRILLVIILFRATKSSEASGVPKVPCDLRKATPAIKGRSGSVFVALEFVGTLSERRGSICAPSRNSRRSPEPSSEGTSD